jgi:hypothetical protein
MPVSGGSTSPVAPSTSTSPIARTTGIGTVSTQAIIGRSCCRLRTSLRPPA